MPSEDDELEIIASRIASALNSTPQLSALFKYLWEHRSSPVQHKAIWEDGGLKSLCRSSQKDQKTFDFRVNVRQAVLDLRHALGRYFKNAKRQTWRIGIPPGIPGIGYQLKCLRVDIAYKVTAAFWQPHLQGEYPVSVVYVEQLFFHEQERGMVFRFYDCNEEHSEAAIQELIGRHGDEFPANSDRRPIPIYPYVAKGDAQAAHLIGKWFANYAGVQVVPVTTRNLEHDDAIEEHSLILLGSAPTNRFIRRLLRRYEDLPFRLEDRTRVSILSPDENEQRRINELAKRGSCQISPSENGCILDFNRPGKDWPAILTRVPNLSVGHLPTTVFNTDFGSAAYAITDLLTDEHRLSRSFESLGLRSVTDHFQFLYCVDASRRDAIPRIQPIAWRPVTPIGI